MTPAELSTLQRWIDLSRSAGRDLLRLFAPGGLATPILSEKIREVPSERDGQRETTVRPTAQEIVDAATSDAILFTGDAVYTLTSSSEGGHFTGQTRLRIPGGKAASSDEIAVDVERVTSSGAALGHMVRNSTALSSALIASNRELKELCLGILAETRKDNADLRAHVRKLQSTVERRSHVEVALKKLEMEQLDGEGFWRTIQGMIAAVVPYAGALLARGGGKGGAALGATALDDFMASMSDAEAAAVLDVLGPTVLRARGPQAIAVLYDAVEALPLERRQALLLVFQADQQRFATLAQLLTAEHERRRREPGAAAAAGDASAPASPSASSSAAANANGASA